MYYGIGTRECMYISFNSGSQKLLKCPNIWISNTGATQHSTFSTVGGINKQEFNIKTKGQSGTATSTLILMDFKVKLCYIHDNFYGKTVLKDVQINENFQPTQNQLAVKGWFYPLRQ